MSSIKVLKSFLEKREQKELVLSKRFLIQNIETEKELRNCLKSSIESRSEVFLFLLGI